MNAADWKLNIKASLSNLQFGYCTLVWMFPNKTLIKSIYKNKQYL